MGSRCWIRGALVAGVALLTSACGDSGPAPAGPATSDALAVDAAGDEGTGLADVTIDTTTDSDAATGPEVPAATDVVVDLGPVATGPIGGDRPAAVTLPEDYTHAEEWPLVILLHGLGANGFIQDAYLQFSAQATTLGFVAVVPEGTTGPDGKQFWNAMLACCDFYGTGVDDEAYLLSLIDEAKGLWNIDPERVFFMGHSNGGYMSYRMACNNADIVAGLVSIAGSSFPTSADCAPSQPVKVLQAHGSLDTVVAYSGTAFTPGAQALVDRWVARNQCTSGPVDGGTGDYDTAVPGEETTITWHRDCADGAEVGFFDMAGTGHIPTFTDTFIVDALTWLLGTPN